MYATAVVRGILGRAHLGPNGSERPWYKRNIYRLQRQLALVIRASNGISRSDGHPGKDDSL